MRGVSREAINDLIKRRKLKTKVIGGVTFVFRRQVLSYEPESGGRPAKRK